LARAGGPRAFRTPFVPWVPLLGIVACIYLPTGLPLVTWVRFAVWLLAGLVVYSIHGLRKSSLRAQEARQPLPAPPSR
jgi:APA family basic amino acid/polyamine antiporter